jgi:urea transport system permease protein
MGFLKSMRIDKCIVFILFLGLFIVPVFSSPYDIQFMGKYVTFMILALALDLLWGGAGLLNLGFALFFGLGGYVFGIALSVQNGVPAFMQSGGFTQLPYLYMPLQNLGIATILAILIPAIVALFLGYFMFSSKITGAFFTIITLACAALFELLIINQAVYTGGSSGITGIVRGLKHLTVFGIPYSIIKWYYLSVISLLVIYGFCVWLAQSRFGKIINSVRDNEARIQFLGQNTTKFKIFLFVISGAIAGYAGVLYVPMASVFSVDNVSTTFSAMMIIWLTVGGKNNFAGAMVGALIISLLQQYLSGFLGNIWLLVLSFILIGTVMFIPNGIVGTLLEMQHKHHISKILNKNEKISNKKILKRQSLS